MFKEEVNFLLKGKEERQLAKKIVIVSSVSIFKFLLLKIPSKKKMCHIKNF
jgi:hypothetical protein